MQRKLILIFSTMLIAATPAPAQTCYDAPPVVTAGTGDTITVKQIVRTDSFKIRHPKIYTIARKLRVICIFAGPIVSVTANLAATGVLLIKIL